MKRKQAKTVPARKRKAPRSSKRDLVVAATIQSFAHSDSRVIVRKRDVLTFELATVEDHLVGLRASMSEVSARKATLEAKIHGLGVVIAGR